MTTLIKVIVTALLSMLFVSCQFSFGARGNGNVTTTDRTVSESFDAIEVHQGLDVFITQNDTESISVQADENLQDIIMTEVKDGVLHIYSEDNIGYAESKKIMGINYFSTKIGRIQIHTRIILATYNDNKQANKKGIKSHQSSVGRFITKQK